MDKSRISDRTVTSNIWNRTHRSVPFGTDKDPTAGGGASGYREADHISDHGSLYDPDRIHYGIDIY